jgi:hypothetical protein
MRHHCLPNSCITDFDQLDLFLFSLISFCFILFYMGGLVMLRKRSDDKRIFSAFSALALSVLP